MTAPAPLAAASLLQLIWLASPALPVGGFSYSEGLEAGVEWAGVTTENAASDWIVDQLHLSQARSSTPPRPVSRSCPVRPVMACTSSAR